MKEKSKALQKQAKAERIQHHQTSSPTNAKGSSLDRKHTKRVYKLEPKTIKEMATGSYLSIITLNVNGLNAPTKRQKQTPIYAVYKRPISKQGTHTD